MDLLKDFNVKRISFGVQTYKPKIRELFNIVATLDDIDNVTRNARDRNFHEINVDMMYDLPNQTLTDLEYDLKHLAEHDFDSIDYYNLHYYAFPDKMKVDMSKPSEKMHFILGEQLSARLIDMGYNHVADQIFTKESQVCEYFRLLWGGGYGDHTAETIAIGASARGYINGFSYMNYGNTNKYLKLVEENKFVFEKISTPLEKPENRAAVFFPKFYQLNKKYAQVIKTIPENILNLWVKNGLAFEIDGTWYLSQKGKSWTTNMMVDAFEPLQHKKALQSAESLALKAGTRTGSF
ncbi:radical SAM protein [Candidatus Marithrix sp. Canyon 246]|uniref:radical SAM protein n=1 Tax=Candidatus Marithrix sp. Canyon 246 TaxID=1827136 RepID=UPI00084A0869|nr:radical SAM protein [Candidatus Marithrix sp. Canyon 246]